MPTVQLPGGQTASFPDGTPVEQIESEVSKFANATADVPEIAAPKVVLDSDTYPGNLSFGELSREFSDGQSPEVSDNLTERYRNSGIDMQGAPPETRFLANLGLLDAASSVRMARASLENTVGGAVEVGRAKVAGSDDDNGPVIWRKAGDRQWKFFNTPGPSKGDLSAALPHVAQIGTEVVAGVGGGIAGAPAGPAGAVAVATVAEGATAFATEVTRLYAGQARGLPMTDEEIWNAAYWNGGLAALGAAGLPIAVKAFKIATGKKVPAFIRKHASEEDLDKWIAEADALGDGVPRTVGQIAPVGTEARDRLLGLERDVSHDKVAGAALREVIRNQNRHANARVAATVDVPPSRASVISPEGEPIVGQEVKDRITAPGLNAERIARQAVQGAEDIAEVAAARVGGDTLNAATAAGSLRGAFSEGREKIFTGLKTQYGELDERLMQAVGPLPSTRRVASRLNRNLDRRLAQSILAEDKSLVGDFVRGTVNFDDAGNITGFRQVDLLDLQREMSDLKDELRKIGSTDSNKKAYVLNDLLDALRKDRDEILAQHNDPSLKEALELLDQQWRKSKDEFDRGIVGAILKEKPGSTRDSPSYQMGLKRIIPAVLQPDNTKRVMDAFANPVMKDHSYALIDLRRGIMDDFHSRFVNQETGRISNAAGANRWLNQNRQALDQIMDPAQRRAMTNAATWATKIRQVRRLDQDMTRTINRMLETDMRSWDSGAVISNLWSQGNFDKIAMVNRTLRAQHPEVHRVFREASRVHVLKNNGVLSWDTKAGNWTVDAAALEDLIAGNKGNVVSHMKTVLGADYVDDLKGLNKFLASVQRAPDFQLGDISREAGATPTLYGPSQFLRVYFAPLSPRGRALTAYKQIKTESTRRALAEAVADPKKLKLMLKLRYLNKWNATAYSIMGALGMEILTQPDPLARNRVEQQREQVNDQPR